MVSDTQVREALHRSLSAIVTAIKNTIEETPPELISDIIEQGIMMAGGGSLVRGLDTVIHEATRIRTQRT
jgi:rod shape-determining protein MreB